MTDTRVDPEQAKATMLRDVLPELLRSYQSDERMHHLDSTFLPNRDRCVEILELLRRIVFPGFFDAQRITSETVTYHAGDLLATLHDLLYEQIRQALRYELNRTVEGKGDHCEACDEKAAKLACEFLRSLPELRRLLATDVQAGFDGDPAAASTDEIIFCYPGLDAIFTHRVAHRLHTLGIPLIPRILSEYAHNETGIDIHPGATIDESFFIDHGTGVVIGETCVIGKHVKVYQGVTLGAISTKGGQDWRGKKRHPTIEDDVTIYGGAIILGGATVIGKGATVGGSVFITSSVPPGHSVTVKAPELKVAPPRQRRASRSTGDAWSDFAI